MNLSRAVIVTDHGHINGGVSQVALQSATALADAGIPVTLVFGVGPADSSVIHRDIEVVDLGVHDLLTNPSRVNAFFAGIWNRRAASGMSSVLRSLDPRTTIVHVHGWTKSLSSSVIRVALQRRFKVLLTLHDYFAVCPNGGLFNYPQKETCRLKPMSLRCIGSHCDARSYTQKLWRVARHLVQQHVGGIPGRLTEFVSVSEFSEDLIRPHLSASARITRVTNPIDVEKDTPARPADHSVFSFIGRLSPEKGPDLFAKAAAQAGVDAQFIGAGESGGAVLECNRSARLQGWCDRDAVRAHIKATRAVVFPSRWYETQGMAVLEAAALGVPCIVSDACAARDHVMDGVTGLWFRSGSVKSLAEKLRFMSDNPAVANAMGQAAYDRYWASPTDRQRHVSELLMCYRNALAT